MMMLRSSDLVLKRFAQAFGESAMESLKQAILDHELTFRNQVRDLHRLYWTQKNLMNELCQNGAIPFSVLSSATEVNPQVGNALYRNEDDLFKNHHRSFNLQLPADDFINILSNANGTLDIGKGLLSSGVSGCNEIIDLEASMVHFGDIEAQIQKGPGLFGSKSTVQCDRDSLSMKRNSVCCVPSMVHFGEGQDRRLQKHRPHVSFVGLDNSSMACINDHSSKTHEFRAVLIDLNVSHEDESFHHQNDPGIKIPFPSMDSSVVPHGVIRFEPTESFPDTFKPGLANPGAITSYEKKAECLFLCGQDSILADNITKNNSDIDNILDINAVSSAYEVPAACYGDQALSTNEASISSMEVSKQEKEGEDFPLRFIELSDSKRQDSNITSSNSINLPQSVTRDATVKLGNQEESEEDTLSSLAIVEDDAQQDALLVKVSFECNSNGMSESSSYEKGADDSVITQFHSPENEEQDITTVAAAETLLTMSFGGSAITAKKIDIIEAIEVQCDDRSDQPQPSSDSFETMTMQLSEIQHEEEHVMPDILSVNETEKDEKRLRPRRGRRLQDFQKKILPGLVSLSRHEICEDLYNISYKLRKNTVTSSTGNFFVPVGSRRSRSYSGRQWRRSFQWFQAGE